MSALRVVIADDHLPTRAGVRAALEEAGFEVCAEAPDAAGAVELARIHAPDICLLDVNMPGGGVAAAAQITALAPDCAIVMLTVSSDDADLFDALRAGACGYLLKDIKRHELPDALRGVVAGEAALPPSLAAKLIREFQQRSQRRRLVLSRRGHVELSTREWDVLELLRQGCSTADIAARLGIAEVTVRTHIASTLKKLRVPDRKAALALLDERGT